MSILKTLHVEIRGTGDPLLLFVVGRQWELRGLWRVERESRPRFPSESLPRRREFCSDGDLGSSNRPFPRRRPRSNGSKGAPSRPDLAGSREAALEPHRVHPPRPHPGSLKEGWHPDGGLRARWSETTGHWRSGDGGERTGFELSTIALR